MPSLEEHLQAFATAAEKSDDGQWEQGEAILNAMRDSAARAPDAKTAKKMRHALFGAFAQVGKCTRERIRQLAETRQAYREVPRAADQSWTWHRHVMLAARRAGRELPTVIGEAQAATMGIRELRHYGNGRPGPETIRLDARCGECGAHVQVSLSGDGAQATWGGLLLMCPVCLAMERPASRIGALR